MAGHSHWAGIKHKKALIDSKRSKVWSKCAKAIIVAARMGGGDLDANNRLRGAVADAKAANMPKDKIERAIKTGTGELAGGNVEEVIYEGYGPAGVAIMCEAMTDNRNRTAPELRKLFEVNQGKLGSTNDVAWMFDRKGFFLVDAEKATGDQLMEIALESGADDVTRQGDQFQITCGPELFSDVLQALEDAEIEPDTKRVSQMPKNTIELDATNARSVLRLLEALDDHDDIQNVSANFDIADEVMAEISADN